MDTGKRLQSYLRHYCDKYPGAWKTLDEMRRDLMPTLNWPNWCYCPIAGSAAIVYSGKTPGMEEVQDMAALAALSAWRLSRGIFRFDADFYKLLFNTPVNEIPYEVIYKIPQWCVYIECPEPYCFFNSEVVGFFFFMEYDVDEKHAEIRFVLDLGTGDKRELVPSVVDCVGGTLYEGLMNALQGYFKKDPEMKDAVKEKVEETVDELAKFLSGCLSVVLYLCSENPDVVDPISSSTTPRNPLPKKVKGGERIFPATREVVWQVGSKIGKAVREASGEGGGWKVRPHIRKAHWHSYWIGKRDSDDRKIILKWIPPTIVAADAESENEVQTIYRVKNAEQED